HVPFHTTIPLYPQNLCHTNKVVGFGVASGYFGFVAEIHGLERLVIVETHCKTIQEAKIHEPAASDGELNKRVLEATIPIVVVAKFQNAQLNVCWNGCRGKIAELLFGCIRHWWRVPV